MDLTSAEKSAQKILDYIQTVVESDSRLYAKSKYKLGHISNICLNIVSLSSKLLQNEILESEEGEFGSGIDPKVVSTIHNLYAEAEKLKTFLPDNKPEVKYSISPTDAKEVIKTYKFILSDIHAIQTPNKCVKRCIDIIYKWFDARILTHYDEVGKFKYDVFKVKTIIYSIIIMYGRCVERGTVDEFESQFDDWISKLDYVPKSVNWIAPYDVYKLEKSLLDLDSEYANLTSMIIFDIIWDLGADAFKKRKVLPEAYLNNKEFWRILSNSDSSVLDNYEYYANDDSTILEDYNIV